MMIRDLQICNIFATNNKRDKCEDLIINVRARSSKRERERKLSLLQMKASLQYIEIFASESLPRTKCFETS